MPLASQTQFVERGVKEAKIVAATGGGEAQCSCYAIIRSFNVHCTEIEAATSVPERIKFLIANGEAAVARKQELIQKISEDAANV